MKKCLITTAFQNAYKGSLSADALAMPVHWYYNREALRRDYGTVDHLMAPRNPHTGSILWRSSYQTLNEKGDILREQAQYWGRRDVHYHQFLTAGENTLNFKLAALEGTSFEALRRIVKEHVGLTHAHANVQRAAGNTANTMVGGCNCHRGAVVGSLLGAVSDGIPEGLQVECDIRQETAGR